MSAPRVTAPFAQRHGTGALVRLPAALGVATFALTACAGGGGQAADGSRQDARMSQAAAPPTGPTKITTGPELDFDLIPGNGKTVGTGQPVALEFAKPVKNKAAVEKALTVQTSNDTEGAWGWVTTPTGQDRLDWRPKDPWKPGTKVRVKGDLTTVDPGDGHFTRTLDRSFTIGRDQRLVADLDTHTLTVTRDGKVVRTIPMSGGEPVPGRASRPGTFAIESQEHQVHMTSASVGGPKEYDKQVYWAMRFSDSGGYLHAAPWADANGDLGVRNSSAGCIGMSDADAASLFKDSLLGDLVTIKGKEATTELGGPGNGFADWSLTWEQWQGKSALHH
ncbi:L,D-transpeptidase [Streptomyces sp. UNOC14_S4]|uniref:L,D-transpeptidase n=1 Tax=Streptomyces sp. UNOC14_S4 TaxID=2872340 RepID=UPI001E342F80|nr:L,D-transpeptidase [Streptomyces sp. UNOC14_S4]MCC3769128.1 L,D-transpeptidase [Streptomyces sp. UNOC14_S4]